MSISYPSLPFQADQRRNEVGESASFGAMCAII